jgi:DNA polymerase III epsilon subunit-like protein
MALQMAHNNGHVVAVIDTETTGLRARWNDIVQVCVLPVDSDFQPLRGVVPFYAEMKPKRPKNIDFKGMTVNRLTLDDIMKRAPDAAKMADLFTEWYRNLPLPHGKCLMPLAHNWPFDRGFLEDWLGPAHMEHFFHPYYRDLMMLALGQNDIAAYHLQNYPYPKLNLNYLCNVLGVENMKAHDALGDCLATAACYRELLRRSAWTPVVLTEEQSREIPVEDRPAVRGGPRPEGEALGAALAV